MIKIEIEKEKESKQIIYFKISGHAESADYGEDIICASVSAVGQMTLNGLIEILELDKLKYREAEGIIDCDLKTSGLTEEENEKACILTKSMYSYLKEVAKEYKKFVKLIIREV